jgi:hypothetical protein
MITHDLFSLYHRLQKSFASRLFCAVLVTLVSLLFWSIHVHASTSSVGQKKADTNNNKDRTLRNRTSRSSRRRDRYVHHRRHHALSDTQKNLSKICLKSAEPIMPFESREMHVFYNPTEDQLHRMICELLHSFSTYSQAAMALMQLYIAGSRSNQKTDFNAKIVDGRALVIFPPDTAMIALWGTDTIPGMATLLAMVKEEGKTDLACTLEELLEKEGYTH